MCNVPHHYLIVNDTDLTLHVKQFDTEETCVIRPGRVQPYTWRTHKRAQLMQLFVAKYRLHSSPFQINQNGVSEIRFEFTAPVNANVNVNKSGGGAGALAARHLSLVLSVEERSTRLSPMESALEAGTSAAALHKRVTIQAKLVVANYSSVRVDSLILRYACNVLNESSNQASSSEHEVHIGESASTSGIEPSCRSATTYELVEPNESADDEDDIELAYVKINGHLITTTSTPTSNSSSRLYRKLLGGVLCNDPHTRVKYWLTLYEQKLALTRTSVVAEPWPPSPFLVVYTLILSPLLVVCSYLPYELNATLVNVDIAPPPPTSSSLIDSARQPLLQHHHPPQVVRRQNIRPNVVTHLGDQLLDDDDMSQVQIKFSAKNNNNNADYDDELHWREPPKLDDVQLVAASAEFNVSKCMSPSDKRLTYANLIRYMFRYAPSSSPFTAAAATTGAGRRSKSIASVPTYGKFQVDQRPCWSFSPTVRVDLRPIAYVVNRTEYAVRMCERVVRVGVDPSSATELKSPQQFECDVKPNGGHQCLHDVGVVANNPAGGGFVKKYRFSVRLDECSMQTSGSSMQLVRQQVEYASDWIEMSDEPVTPFYRERDQYRMNKLYASKCWIDLKLYPSSSINRDDTTTPPQPPPRLKCIYLLLHNADIAYATSGSDEAQLRPPAATNAASPMSSSAASGQMANGGGGAGGANGDAELSATRVITIEPKFAVHNKTPLDLTFQLDNDSLSCPNGGDDVERRTRLATATSALDAAGLLSCKAGETCSLSSVLDSTQPQHHGPSSEFDNQSSLVFLNVGVMEHKSSVVEQSKSLILAVNEKAIKQMSNMHPNEDLLVGRQCFCLYTYMRQRASVDLCVVSFFSFMIMFFFFHFRSADRNE